MRAIGLDLGSKTVGVALSDLMRMIAQPKTTIRFESDDYETAIAEVVKIIKENDVTTIVLGLPKHMNGDIGERAQISLDFGKKLEELLNMEVIYWDERLTTAAANRILLQADVSRKNRKKVIDQMAAVQILQGYLDRS